MKYSRTLALIALMAANPSFGNVTAYQNHNISSSYTEPYRKITRAGDNLEQVIVDHIKSAKKNIFVAVQELRLPQVALALIAKKKEGLDVRIVLEHDYNFTVTEQQDSGPDDQYEASKLTELKAFVDINGDGKLDMAELDERDAVHMLRKAKVQIIDDTFDNSYGSGLMHHKFVVVDSKQVLISSANFTMSCVHGDMLMPDSRGNPNSIVMVKSKALSALFDEEFLQMWGNGLKGRFGQSKIYRGPQTVLVGKAKVTVQFSPISSRYSWEESVNGLISKHLNQAKKTVKAALFVYSDQKIGNVLEQRHEEGVKLDFLVEQKFAYRNYSELLDMLGLEMLSAKCSIEPNNSVWRKPNSEAGTTYLPRGDVLHHKFAVIDNKTVIMGSQNWSEAANYVNDETLIVVQNSPISETFTQEYDRLKRSSLRGPPVRVRLEIERLNEACRNEGYM